MRARTIALTLLLLLLIAPAAAAQSPLVIAQLGVDIWPEYDRPEVLVIYHIALDPGTSLPANVSLRIPAAAGEPFNVAVRDPADGQLYNVNHEQTVEGEWVRVDFTATSTQLQFEYYDPGIQRADALRTFTYRWPGDYAVGALSIQVQQPVGAEAMQISPMLGSGIPGEGGLVYYQAQVGTVPAGEEFDLTFQYQKPNDVLSIESLQVQPAAPITDQTAGRANMTDVLPWVLGGLGVVLIGGGAWWYWQSGRSTPAGERQRRRHTANREAPRPSAETADDVVYCSSCGKRSGPGDQFCRVCGTPLRRD